MEIGMTPVLDIMIELTLKEEKELRNIVRNTFVPGIDTPDNQWHPVCKNEARIMCREMLSEPIRSTSSVCIMRNVHGQILLLEKADSIMEYCLPGGHIEDDETPLEACYREVLEETGKTLPENSLRLVGETYSASGKHVYVYSCDCVVSEDVVLSDEHDNYMFVHMNELDSLPSLYGRTKKYLELNQ